MFPKHFSCTIPLVHSSEFHTEALLWNRSDRREAVVGKLKRKTVETVERENGYGSEVGAMLHRPVCICRLDAGCCRPVRLQMLAGRYRRASPTQSGRLCDILLALWDILLALRYPPAFCVIFSAISSPHIARSSEMQCLTNSTDVRNCSIVRARKF